MGKWWCTPHARLWKPVKTSLLVLVPMLIVCTENVHFSFFPTTPGVYSIKTPSTETVSTKISYSCLLDPALGHKTFSLSGLNNPTTLINYI